MEYVYKATVTRVIDGDTFEAEVDLGFYVMVVLRFRLANIDTPEIYRPSGEEELQHGREAKDFVENLILGEEVHIKSYKTGLYGRWIGNVWTLDDLNLCEELKKAGFEKRKNYSTEPTIEDLTKWHS